MTKRKLVLENGTEFIGEAFGGNVREAGEVIFFTGMSGYQEMMTDPSYTGKIVVTTFPTIGAYGVNRDDFEAISPAIDGLIVHELYDVPSNFRSEENVDTYLKRHNIPGISGIDTRQLTKLIREEGVMKGKMLDADEALHSNAFLNDSNEMDMLEKVSISKPYIIPGHGKRIVVIDLGVKQSMLHELTSCGCHITVVPYNCETEEMERFKPDGIMLSNGPGNPENMPELINAVQTLKQNYPLFGIGLGYELIALAYGAKLRKLHVSNYGVNMPVKNLQAKKTSFTTLSHDYIVDESSLPVDFDITHRILHDQAIAGLKHQKDAVMGIQFHPEGAPGTDEMKDLFTTFLDELVGTERINGGNKHA